MVGYVVLGCLVFLTLEADYELQTKTDMRRTRAEYVSRLWNMTEKMNVLHPLDWKKEASLVLKNYTDHVS